MRVSYVLEARRCGRRRTEYCWKEPTPQPLPRGRGGSRNLLPSSPREGWEWGSSGQLSSKAGRLSTTPPTKTAGRGEPHARRRVAACRSSTCTPRATSPAPVVGSEGNDRASHPWPKPEWKTLQHVEMIGDDRRAFCSLPAVAPARALQSEDAGSKGRRRLAGAGGYGGSASVRCVFLRTIRHDRRQVGDLLKYGIEKPVTVRRISSALVPILLKTVCRKECITVQRSEGRAAGEPDSLRRVREHHRADARRRPVTVLEQGSYVGEAMLDTMKPTEKRRSASVYAVELAVQVLRQHRLAQRPC